MNKKRVTANTKALKKIKK